MKKIFILLALLIGGVPISAGTSPINSEVTQTDDESYEAIAEVYVYGIRMTGGHFDDKRVMVQKAVLEEECK